ncbi:phenylalanine--tRNA ligase subunit beta [Beijerinckia indica]|uniref:Phenylalanine--tRNA ligase beta subunit n=1 Tax=Beijerinckia indica subsp. indica (strain ATCC 9039 / DSM 1715 / NCIMB 8712) TaxID=395963 RepID=B2ID42_BEII9|nr:phenylalanine--tRNA ligase subunit beta [Beijerinckia indica]ACB96807.1 phenylalanyl-tRNA synthetase, beta subunit [Beijerinckia indica subsp. indica ATCC 9039]
MKFTLSWLKDHLETEATLPKIVETLTDIGLEVEAVEDPAKDLHNFIIAAVLEAEPHPNADRLRVCRVDIGDGKPVQVVCGAPNARAGMKSVFSPPGTYIPGKKITLGKGVIRGVESDGMLCSGAELGLSEDHDGILDLPADAPVGQPYAVYAGLDDPVIDINLLPNRPDAMGVAGIARDLAAANLGALKTPRIAPITGVFDASVEARIDLPSEKAALCPVFALRLVRNVRNGPSPEWLQKRLKAIGLRPINALVDITNFLAFDRARPLHVFDADKISGAIAVRLAKAGESLVALDGKTYPLAETMVVIADDNGVESLAGIMGGAASGCDENTKNVLIESALWDPVNIARSGRALGINTDARYRFERGIDPAFTLPGLDLATALVQEFCGGEPSKTIIKGEVPQHDTYIQFPWSEVTRLTGVELDPSTMAGILENLGFALSVSPGNSNLVLVRAPSFRPDIEGKADIVEEIIRVAGLDKVASQPLPAEGAPLASPVLTLAQKRARAAKRSLAANGLVEAVTWSFIDKTQAGLFGGGGTSTTLANPISADLSAMRPSLLPGLLAAAKRNRARGFADIALFEVGQIFLGDGEKDQKTAATGIRQGLAQEKHWSASAKPVDAFLAKGDAMALLTALGVSLGGLQIVPGGADIWHPGRSATLQFGPKNIIGTFGELNPRLLAALDMEGPVVGFEIRLDALPLPKAKPTKAKSKLDLSDFMPLRRDFAFVVDRQVKAADLVKAVQGAERALLADVDVFDVYEGKGIADDKKSVGITVVLQPREKTLTEAEIEAIASKIVTEVGKKTGAVLRA